MNVQWTNLGINVGVWVCCFLASEVLSCFSGEARPWAIGMYLLTCMLVGSMLGLFCPVVRL